MPANKNRDGRTLAHNCIITLSLLTEKLPSSSSLLRSSILRLIRIYVCVYYRGAVVGPFIISARYYASRCNTLKCDTITSFARDNALFFFSSQPLCAHTFPLLCFQKLLKCVVYKSAIYFWFRSSRWKS